MTDHVQRKRRIIRRTAIATCISAGAILSAAHAGGPVFGATAQAGIPLSEHLDAQAARVVRRFLAFQNPPLPTLSAGAARNTASAQDAAMGVQSALHIQPQIQPVGNVRHMVIPSPAGGILARVYTPPGTGPFPVLVYFHGGGWVIANLDTYDSSCRALADAAHFVVVSVAYRQAPEHKFPAAANDAYAATQWVMHNTALVNGISSRVAVGGESAGGNLAAVVALMARNMHGLMPIYQLLVYPITNYNFNTPSYRQEAHAVPLDRPSMKWFWRQYLRTPADGANQYASPLRAPSLQGLPPATVITDQNDPLRSEGEAYALRLRASGVPVVLTRYNGMMHEFFGMGAVIAKAKQAEAEAARGLDSARSH